MPEGCRRSWCFRGHDAFAPLRRCPGPGRAGAAAGRPSAGAALPPTLRPGSALLKARRGRCHSYRHSLEKRGGGAGLTSFLARRCSAPPASFGSETLHPPPRLSTCALPQLAPSPSLRRRGARQGAQGSPRGACAVRGPPPLWCRRRRRRCRCRLPAGKCGKEELRAAAAVAAMGVSEAGRRDARAGSAPRSPRPLRPHCSLNPPSRDPDTLRPHVTPNPHMTRLPHSKCPPTRRSPGIPWGAPFSGLHPLGCPPPPLPAPRPSRRARPAFSADLLSSWPLPDLCAVPGVPPAPRRHPSPGCHRLRGSPHPRSTLARRELRPGEEAPSQGHTGREQGPDPDSGLPRPPPLAALPATRILGEAGAPPLFPNLSTGLLLLLKRPLPFQQRPVLEASWRQRSGSSYFLAC